MKKLVIILIATFSFVFAANAQDIFQEDDKVLNLGIGLGSTLYSGSGYSGLVPPISASLEYCVKDNLFDENSSIGVGGYLGFATYKWKYTGWTNAKWTYTNIILGGRGALHYQFMENLDTYAGLMLGYNIGSSKYTGSDNNPLSSGDSSGGFVWSYFIGARYYISNNLAIMGELGYGITYLNLGIALKL